MKKNVYFTEQLPKNALSGWVGVYLDIPGCELLELATPACGAAGMLRCTMQQRSAGKHSWHLWGWGQALLSSAGACVLHFKVHCLHMSTLVCVGRQNCLELPRDRHFPRWHSWCSTGVMGTASACRSQWVLAMAGPILAVHDRDL